MILDTNVYSALDKADPIVLRALAGVEKAYVPIVVVGELQFGFQHGNRITVNNDRLVKFLSRDTVEILSLTTETARIYGELSILCKKRGRAASNNDIWIAALAREHDLPLVTFDKDFVVFTELLGDQLRILGY